MNIETRIAALNKCKSPIVAIDTALDKYRGRVLFPKKLALAEKKLKGIKLPDAGQHLL
jgi:hypothetical protein